MSSHPFKHLHTINKHRRGVIANGAHLGIFWHCLRHDLSKYSHAEFSRSKKLYTGTVSPVAMERKENGHFSFICQHHTRRNKHHWEYWTDFYNGGIIAHTIPYVYALEYIADVISASKTYEGKEFQPDHPYIYIKRKMDHYYMTTATKEFILWALDEYAKNGWKNLKKKNTKPKYLEITSKHPRVETYYELQLAGDLLNEKKGI